MIIVSSASALAAARMGRYGTSQPQAIDDLWWVACCRSSWALWWIKRDASHRRGQRVAISFSDPLGRGLNVFGSAEMGVNSAIFDYPTAITACKRVPIVGRLHRRRIVLPWPVPAAAGNDRLHLRRPVVRPWRGRDIARLLIEAVYAFADESGAASVYWLTQE